MTNTPRRLTRLDSLRPANEPSDVTAIIGYGFKLDDVSRPITAETLEAARAIVRRAAAEGALWLDADTGITNIADAFIYDPALSYYPLAQAILDEAHRAGIKVFFYLSGTEIETPNASTRAAPRLEDQHPDWLQVDQHGEPMVFKPGELNLFWLDADTASARLTPLAPGFRDALFTRAAKLAELGADGIFVDVPYFFAHDGRWSDLSEHSARAFKADTGFDLPRNLHADGQAWRVWLDWRHAVWRDYFAELRARVRAANPDTLIIIEEVPGGAPLEAIYWGLDPAIADAVIDVAAHEYDHKQDAGGALVYEPADWQHTRDVYKWYQGLNRVNWSLCYATNAPDSRALAAITYAHQLSFWETRAPGMVDASVDPVWRRQLLAWVKQRGAAFNGAQPIAEIAVLYSGRARNLSNAASLAPLKEIQHALDAAGLPYVVIAEPNIVRIHDFPYLILPGVKSVTGAARAEVEKYTGALLLTGDSLTRDEWDERDARPPALAVTDAVARITTTPIEVRGGDGLFVELFRAAGGFQIRLFNPELDADFAAAPRAVTLRFGWDGPAPRVTQLDFMADAPAELRSAVTDGVAEVKATIGLMTVITVH